MLHRAVGQSCLVTDQSLLDSGQNPLDTDQPRLVSNQPRLVSNQPRLVSNQPLLESAQPLRGADQDPLGAIQTLLDSAQRLLVAKSLCRQYAITIKTNAGVTDGDKLSIGVRPPNPNRDKIDCPTTQPLLNILGNTPGVQTVVYADSSTPDSKKRPFGASELQLFMAISTEADAPLADAKFVGKFTRNPIDVSFDEGDDGKVATYYGRWASVRGEVGPFSLPISMRIAA